MNSLNNNSLNIITNDLTNSSINSLTNSMNGLGYNDNCLYVAVSSQYLLQQE